MTEIYDGTEFKTESERKKKRLIIWLVISFVVLAVNVILFVYFCLQPYQWSGRTALYWIQVANVAVYLCICLAYYSLKYKRLRAYCKVLRNVQTGLKEIYTGEYIGVSLNTEVKEGVEFYVMLVMEFNSIKQIYFERKVLIDTEKEIPVFQEGDILHFVTQANMLVSYEVLPRPEDEPTMQEKRRKMAAKDKERLFDNVILDPDAVKKLKKKQRRKLGIEDVPITQEKEPEEVPITQEKVSEDVPEKNSKDDEVE